MNNDKDEKTENVKEEKMDKQQNKELLLEFFESYSQNMNFFQNQI